MTGIERLRALAYKKNFLEPAEARELDAIADQIKREQGGRVSRMRVLAVVTDMERHCLGHEGMGDSPVARWARELRDALGGDGRDRAADVSVSAYDLLPQEDCDALAWVREHGGLDAVERRWECLSYYADPVPRSCMEKRLARLQRQIDESHAALRRRNQRIALLESEINRAHNENRMEFLRRAGNYTAFADEVCKRLAPQLRYVEGCTKDVMDAALDALDRRLVPEGIEWPRYESGELVMLGDTVTKYIGGGTIKVRSVEFLGNMTYLRERFKTDQTAVVRHGERVRRPAPKVLDADGAEIRVGDTVYHVKDGSEMTVYGIEGEWLVVSVGGRVRHDVVTHRAPVLAADGEPLEVGQTVWDADGMEFRVESFDSNGVWGSWKTDDGWIKAHPCPALFTHQRPVLDADGNRIEPTMDVWWVCEGDERGVHAERLHVESIGEDGLVACDPFNGGTSVVLDPAELYVKKPALDADGVLCREGDEVWEVRSHRRREIVGTHYRDYETGEPLILCDGDDAIPIPATCVTHAKPEPPDSWERIEEDIMADAKDYCESRGIRTEYPKHSGKAKCEDLVRRCRALAERGK